MDTSSISGGAESEKPAAGHVERLETAADGGMMLALRKSCVSCLIVRSACLMVAALVLAAPADLRAQTTRPVAPPPKSAPALRRIGVRDGQFVEKESGQTFQLRGMNYIRLHPTWHGTFSPKRYDAARAEAMFDDLQANGFNVVRVFVVGDPGEGIVESRQATSLSEGYMSAFCDFTARARAHQIYVIPAVCGIPPTARYADAPAAPTTRPTTRPRRGGGGAARGNEMYFKPALIEAKARYMADLVSSIKQHDPNLLSTILAYELDNETNFWARSEPFSRTSGTYTGPDGKTYDLASEAELQRLADDATIHWADASVDAIKAVDPDAMVNINVFTFGAVGRSGPAALRRDETKDGRFPARPLALTQSKLSYLDIHFYPFGNGTLDRDLASIEFPQLKIAAAQRGMPMIMGEFGAFKQPYPTLADASAAMRHHLERVRDLGFVGFMYWTYDTDEQGFLWNAKSGSGQLLDVLREAKF